MKFIATDKDSFLIVGESSFKNIHKLVERLNKAGFGLGSGHDGIELIKKEDEYVLRLSPYVGHFDQYVFFKKYENNRKNKKVH